MEWRVFPQKTLEERSHVLFTQMVWKHKWVRSSLTSGSKAHLICSPQRADFVPTGRPWTQWPPSEKFLNTVLLTRRPLAGGEDRKWHGITWLHPRQRLMLHKGEVEAFASNRSMLKTVGQQADLSASAHKSRYSRNAEVRLCITTCSTRSKASALTLGCYY